MNRALPTFDEMLEQLIACPSVSSVAADLDMGNRALSERLAGWLETLGFRVNLLPIPGQPDKCNVVAVLGQGATGLVLAGHTDTVPYDEGRWSHDPFTVSRHNNRLYGLGTSDMKSFFAIVLEALHDMPLHTLKNSLVVLATADEESGMAGARALLADGKPLGRYALIGEPTGMIPVRAHKGICMLRIILTGRSGHSSNPALGLSALEGMYEVLHGLRDLRSRLQERYRDARFSVPGPTMNFGRIAGGDNPNRICARCELDIDLRITPGIDLETARNLLQNSVRKSVEGLGLEIEFLSLFDGVDAMNTPADSRLVRQCEAHTRQAAGFVSFATEAPLFDQLGMQTVVLGPGSIDVAHQPDEFLEIASIEPMRMLVRNLVQEFCLASG